MPETAVVTADVETEPPVAISGRTLVDDARPIWLRWLDRLGVATIALNATSLIGTSLIGSIVGALYWWLAARFFAPADVGVASAAIATTVLLSAMSLFGTGTLLIAELPRRQPVERMRLVVTASLVCGLTAGGLGMLFALVAPLVSANLAAFGASPLTVLVFALGVSVTAVGGVVDHALIGVLRGHYQLWRNTLIAFGKLGALGLVIVLTDRGPLTLYATWVVSALISFVAVVPMRGPGRISLAALRPEWQVLRRLGRSALEHHALNLSLQAPSLVTPLLVTVLLSPTSNAYFYLASMFASFVFVLPTALSTALFADGAHAPDALARKMRMTLAAGCGLGLLGVSFLFVAAGPLLSVFSRSYADEVGWVFRGLILGVFAALIKAHFVALAQVRGRVRRAAVLMWVFAAAEVGAAALGGSLDGLHGVTVAVVLVGYVEAAIMAPTVLRGAFPHGFKPRSRRLLRSLRLSH
jgi:O-antigen/teichoic acid export membrane protein